MTAYALQALANETMEDKEEMENLTSINLTLSQSLTQSQETMLVLSKQLQALQAQTNSKNLATEKPATDKKNISANQIATARLMEGPTVLTIPDQHADTPWNNTKWGQPWRTGWKEVTSVARKIQIMNNMEGQETLLRRI